MVGAVKCDGANYGRILGKCVHLRKTREEKENLEEEMEMLRTLLYFHVENRSYISMDDEEFEEYVNAVLDRLNELAAILKQQGDKA